MRWGRQRLLPEIGEAGQARFARGRVRVEGTGEVAGACSDYLSRAGVGEVGGDVRGPDVLVRASDRPGAARVTARAGTVEAAAAPGAESVFAGALAAVEALKLLVGMGSCASVDVSLADFDFRAGRLP
jgi:molybdopterin/thiamine biosynthesis adenylyltransferase